MTSISRTAFDEIYPYIKTVVLPDGLNSLLPGLFKHFVSLEELVIGKKAFAGCAKGFVLQSSNPKWQAYTLKEKLKFELIDDPYAK